MKDQVLGRRAFLGAIAAVMLTPALPKPTNFGMRDAIMFVPKARESLVEWYVYEEVGAIVCHPCMLALELE